MTSPGTRELIAQAVERLGEEVPSLKQLKLVVRLELRARGDVPIWRVEVPGPKIEAARMMTLKAARMKDAGERSDLEAGMAKLFASETGKEVVEDSFRIHGGYGYSKEYEIERLYRDAPLLLIGEGTSEIQRMVIGKKLLERHKL